MPLTKKCCLAPLIIPGTPRGSYDYHDKQEKQIKWYHTRPSDTSVSQGKDTAIVLFYDVFGFNLVRTYTRFIVLLLLTPSPTQKFWQTSLPISLGWMSMFLIIYVGLDVKNPTQSSSAPTDRAVSRHHRSGPSRAGLERLDQVEEMDPNGLGVFAEPPLPHQGPRLVRLY